MHKDFINWEIITYILLCVFFFIWKSFYIQVMDIWELSIDGSGGKENNSLSKLQCAPQKFNSREINLILGILGELE